MANEGHWRSWLARLHGMQEVKGSNPLCSTNFYMTEYEPTIDSSDNSGPAPELTSAGQSCDAKMGEFLLKLTPEKLAVMITPLEGEATGAEQTAADIYWQDKGRTEHRYIGRL